MFWRRQLPLALLASGLVITAAAWQTRPARMEQAKTDTVPDRHKKVRDIDDVLDELDRGKVEVEQSLRNMDWSQMQADIKRSLKEIDGDKLKLQVEEALRSVDMVKIQADVQKELANIDMVKMKADLQKELSNIDAQKLQIDAQKIAQGIDIDKIRAQVDASLKAVDMDKIKMSIDKAGLDKLGENMEKIKPDMERAIAEAQRGIDRAKKEVRNYKDFIEALDRDGALNKKGEYTIEYKGGTLTVNGKQLQAKNYSRFLQSEKDFTIKKSLESFDINGDNDYNDKDRDND